MEVAMDFIKKWLEKRKESKKKKEQEEKYKKRLEELRKRDPFTYD